MDGKKFQDINELELLTLATELGLSVDPQNGPMADHFLEEAEILLDEVLSAPEIPTHTI